MTIAHNKLVNRPVPVRVQTSAPTHVQRSGLRVSVPSDPAEKEAESTARRVVRMPAPEVRTLRLAGLAPGISRRARLEDEREQPKEAVRDRRLVSPYVARFAGALPEVARKAEGEPDAGSNVAAELTSSLSSGSPLPLGVRRFMEPRFGADFGGVRVHTGSQAAGLTRQFSAQAFAYGNHIFFGRDRFKPETEEGRELVAHELTHTIQQGGAVQRSTQPAVVTGRAAPQVQRLGISDALDYFADKANIIPGFRMFTIVLGVNPINMSRVERSAANIMRAIVEFIPGGGLVTQALDNYGVFDKVGSWVEQQIRTLGMTGAAIKAAVMEFLDSLGWRDIFDLGGVWMRAKRIFTEPIDRIISFAKGLITGILRFIREAILRPLAALAQGTRGYDLLKAVLGEDPVTGDPYPRNADTLIGGFMKLIGQDEIWENIKKSGAIARCWAWFQGALAAVIGFVRQIPQLFIQALQSLELVDLVLAPRAFAKLARVFGAFVGSFISWAGGAVWNLLEIIFSVVAPGVMPYLRKAAGTFRTILQNPIGFVGNLVRAAKAGFNQFAKNILTHLKTSLIQWLTGSLGGLAIYIPQSFEIREIIKFVLSVLGLTWANIRSKLVKAVGETTVKVLEAGFDIVMTLVTQGPAAAWEKIKEQLTNLKELVIEEIMNFVVVKIVQSAIIKLVSLLNPAGAFIQAIIATYNTVMFFIERLRQIIQVATAFIDSISAIASGVIAAAATKVESTLAGLLTLAISFLARLVGLGKVSDIVVNIVNKIRAPIDKALDKVVEWIVATARKVGRFIAQAGLPQDPNERLRLGMAAAATAVRALPGTRIGAAVLTPVLAGIKVRYGFTSLEPEIRGGRWWVRGQINPFDVRDLGREAGAPGAPTTVPSGSDRYTITRLLEYRNQPGILTDVEAGEFAASMTELCVMFDSPRQHIQKRALDQTRDPESFRGNQWENRHGVISVPYLREQSAAITELRADLGLTEEIIALERGGSLVADQLAEGTGTRVTNIPKPTDEKSLKDLKYQRLEHVKLLIARIHTLMKDREDQPVTITVTETWISGSAKNTLVNALNGLLNAGTYPKLVIKLLAIRQTIGEHGERIPAGVIRVTRGKVQVVYHAVPYIVGEDIDYQNIRTGDTSKSPIIIFNATDRTIVAYQITPIGEGTARDIVLDLVAGRFAGKLPGAL